MPRPKNEELVTEITRTAFQQFRDIGYKETSYASIATACGISRGLVQYHFPKKELLAVEMMNRLTEEVRDIVVAHTSTVKGECGPFVQLLYIGQISHQFYVNENGPFLFFRDIIESRSLTSEILVFDRTWTLEFLHCENMQNNPEVIDGIDYIMGGLYEVLFRRLSANAQPEIDKLMIRAISDLMVLLGIEQQAALELLCNAVLSEKEVQKAINALPWPLI